MAAPPDAGTGQSERISGNEARLARVTGAFAALTGNAILGFLAQILTVPIALKFWGGVAYGEWLLITGFVAVLRLSDFGIQTFVVNRLCSDFALKDLAGFNGDLRSALRLQCKFVAVLWIIGLLVYIVPFAELLNIRSRSEIEVASTCLCIITEILLLVPLGVITGVYRATGKMARAATIGSAQQLLITSLTLGSIMFGGSFFLVALLRVIATVGIGIYVLFDLARLYPWLNLNVFGSFCRSNSHRLLLPSFFFLLIPLADYMSTQLMLMVVQHEMGAAELARFATHRTLINSIQMFSGLLLNALWPEITMLHALSDRTGMQRVHAALATMNLMLVSSTAVLVLAVAPFVYVHWTAGSMAPDSWTFSLLACRLLLWAVWSASQTVLAAINSHYRIGFILIASAGVTTLCSIGLLRTFGIKGAALAWLIGDISICAWMLPRKALRETGQSARSFGCALRNPFCVAGALLVTGMLICGEMNLGIGVRIAIVAILYPAFAVLMWRQIPVAARHVTVCKARAFRTMLLSRL